MSTTQLCIIFSCLMCSCISKSMMELDIEDSRSSMSAETMEQQHILENEVIDRVHELPPRKVIMPVRHTESEPQNCMDLYKSGSKENGIYKIYPYDCCSHKKLYVYCDMTTDGGGWTVIQRRDDVLNHENFNRTWLQYALGFGDLTKEFWLGLDHVHELTNQKLNEVRFDLEDFEGNQKYAKYNFFYIYDRDDQFQLEVEGYSGTAGDSFGSKSNGMKFSTKDRDYDKWEHSCAQRFSGSWWFKSCHLANLNGIYYKGNHSSYADGVNWKHWKGYHYSLKKTEMKIRPAFNNY